MRPDPTFWCKVLCVGPFSFYCCADTQASPQCPTTSPDGNMMRFSSISKLSTLCITRRCILSCRIYSKSGPDDFPRTHHFFASISASIHQAFSIISSTQISLILIFFRSSPNLGSGETDFPTPKFLLHIAQKHPDFWITTIGDIAVGFRVLFNPTPTVNS